METLEDRDRRSPGAGTRPGDRRADESEVAAGDAAPGQTHLLLRWGRVTRIEHTVRAVPLRVLRASWWRLPAGTYLAALTALLGVSWLTVTVLGFKEPQAVALSFVGDSILGGWAQWDAGWYHHIATEGYDSHRPGAFSPVAFFPGYPLAMRLGGLLVRDPVLAGVLLTAVSGLGSAVLFWRWCRDRMDVTAATTALLVLLLYPYGYYLYGVVYADALFLFSALAAFTAVERDRPLLAGGAAALAALSRPVGIALVVGVVLRLLERRGVLSRASRGGRRRLRSLARRDGFVLISLAGLVTYPAYLWARFGDPFLFSTVQEAWGQDRSLRTLFKVDYFGRLVEHAGSGYTWGTTLQGMLALAAVATVPWLVRRFGWGYGAYTAIVLAIPLMGSQDFQGLGRYLVAAFPVFALVGHTLAGHTARRRAVVLTVSGCGLALGMGLYSHGYYIS